MFTRQTTSVGTPISVSSEGTRPHTNKIKLPPRSHRIPEIAPSPDINTSSHYYFYLWGLRSKCSLPATLLLRPKSKRWLFNFAEGFLPLVPQCTVRPAHAGAKLDAPRCHECQTLTTRCAPSNPSLVSGSQDAFYAVAGILRTF